MSTSHSLRRGEEEQQRQQERQVQARRTVRPEAGAGPGTRSRRNQ